MSIVVFASSPVCNNDWFITGRKIRTSFLHPSRPYKSFSTALNLGSKYFTVLGKTTGYSQQTRMQLQANIEGPSTARLLAPAAIVWYLHGGSDGTFSNIPQEAKTKGCCLVSFPQLGERTHVCSRVAGSEGLTLLERLQWPCCPLPTTKVTYVDRDALRMEPSWSTANDRTTSHSHLCLFWNKHRLLDHHYFQEFWMLKSQIRYHPNFWKILVHSSGLGKIPTVICKSLYSNKKV